MRDNNDQRRCRNCPRKVSDSAFHFSNIAAHKHGFCSYACMIAGLGQEKALEALNAEKEEGRKRE